MRALLYSGYGGVDCNKQGGGIPIFGGGGGNGGGNGGGGGGDNGGGGKPPVVKTCKFSSWKNARMCCLWRMSIWVGVLGLLADVVLA